MNLGGILPFVWVSVIIPSAFGAGGDVRHIADGLRRAVSEVEFDIDEVVDDMAFGGSGNGVLTGNAVFADFF